MNTSNQFQTNGSLCVKVQISNVSRTRIVKDTSDISPVLFQLIKDCLCLFLHDIIGNRIRQLKYFRVPVKINASGLQREVMNCNTPSDLINAIQGHLLTEITPLIPGQGKRGSIAWKGYIKELNAICAHLQARKKYYKSLKVLS